MFSLCVPAIFDDGIGQKLVVLLVRGLDVFLSTALAERAYVVICVVQKLTGRFRTTLAARIFVEKQGSRVFGYHSCSPR